MVLELVGQEAELREQWPKATLGKPSGLSPLRSDGSHDGQTGRLDQVTGGQRHPMKSGSAALGRKGTYLYRQSVSPQERLNWLFLRGCWRRWDVADEDDEVRTTIATDPCDSKWGLKNLSLEPSIYSQILPSNSSQRTVGGVWFYLTSSCEA